MPYDYDRRQRLYRDADGNYVTRAELRALIDKLSTFVEREAGRIAARFDSGKITAAEFNTAMRELLKAGHIVAASVGKGGRQLMTTADWGRVGAKLRWQYDYLDRFTRKLERGVLKYTANRAKQYTNAIYVSYAQTFKDAQSEVLEPGGKVLTDENMLCRLVQNSKEGCEECTADASEGWMPVAEMGEIGSRICGDFCLCFIEFEDEL